MLAGTGGEVGMVRWEADLGATATGTPALVDGVVYVGTKGGELVALGAEDGGVRWRRTVGGVWGGPSVAANGVVIVGVLTNGECRLVGLHAGTGVVRWSELDGSGVAEYDPGEGYVYGKLVLAPGGMVVCGSAASAVRATTAHDIGDGSIRWRRSRPAVYWADPGVPFAATSGRILAWESCGYEVPIGGFRYWQDMARLVVFDALDGTVISDAEQHPGLRKVAAVCYGPDRTLYRWDHQRVLNSVLVWPRYWVGEWNSGYFNAPVPTYPWAGNVGLPGGATVDVDGMVLTTGSFDNLDMPIPGSTVEYTGCWISRLDPFGTGVGWQQGLTNRWLTAPALSADGVLWYGRDDGRLIGCEAASGRARFDVALGGTPATPLLLTDEGTVLLGLEGGRFLGLHGTAGPPVVSWPHAAGDGRNGQSLSTAGEGAPSFRGAMARRVLAAGNQTRLFPHVSGALPMAWQWYRDGGALLGATNQTLVLTNVQAMDAGTYVLVAANALGRATGGVASVRLGYRLEAAFSGQGELSIPTNGVVLEPGTEFEVRATPKPGKRFLGWWGDPPETNTLIRVVMDRDRMLHAVFSGAGGEVRWEARDVGPSLFAPAVAPDGTVYRATGTPALYAFRGLDGRVLWTHALGWTPTTAVVLAREDRMVVGMQSGRVGAFNRLDGGVCWLTDLGGGNIAVLTVDDEAAYTRSSDGVLAALSLDSGAVRWRTTVATDTESGLARGSGTDLYVGGARPACLRFDAVRGVVAGTIEAAEICRTPLALGMGGTVYFGLSQLVACAARSDLGGMRWRTNVPQMYGRSPVVDQDGSVVFAAVNGLNVLDGRSGVAKTRVASASTTAPVIGDKGLVFFGNGQNLVCGDLGSGEVRWSVALPNSRHAGQPVLGPDGGLVLGTHSYFETSGDVVCIESGTTPAMSAPWPQSGGDAGNTRRLPAAWGRPLLDAVRRDRRIEVTALNLSGEVWVLESAAGLGIAAGWTERAVLVGSTNTYSAALERANQYWRLRAR
jgi:outer membrane protein assembly factor BamB